MAKTYADGWYQVTWSDGKKDVRHFKNQKSYRLAPGSIDPEYQDYAAYKEHIDEVMYCGSVTQYDDERNVDEVVPMGPVGNNFHGLQIPNLNGLPDDDLEAIAAELRKVQDYIITTLNARASRLSGAVRLATIFEGQAESIYKTFAPELKW